MTTIRKVQMLVAMGKIPWPSPDQLAEVLTDEDKRKIAIAAARRQRRVASKLAHNAKLK